MTRDLRPLDKGPFDLLVVGGGIHGVCVAREAALRGLSVALVERDDFGSATSHNSPKIAHGGIRYLQHADIARIRASVRERRMWLATAPHLVRPLEFVMPTRGWGSRSRAALACGFAAYNVLSLDRNRGLPSSHRIPSARTVGRAACLERIPGIESDGVTGGAVWSDGQIIDADGLLIECLTDAVRAGAVVANYCEVRDLDGAPDRVHGAAVNDRVGDETFNIEARWTINAAGPWIAEMLGRTSSPLHHDIPTGLALGMNLVVPGRVLDHGVAAPGTDGRLYFATPWQGKNILGTSHWAAADSPPARMFGPEEVERFLSEFRGAFPGWDIGRADVQYCYAGLTPLDDGEGGASKRSRRSVVHNHSVDGVEGLLTIQGVKYTTARLVAEEAVGHIVRALDGTYGRSVTSTRSLPGAEHPRAPESLESEARRVCRDAWVVHLDDLVVRRLHARLHGQPTADQLECCARVAAEVLEWEDGRRASELKRTVELLARHRPV